MKTKKNTTSLSDDFDIDDIDNPELTDEFFKNAISFSELPEDLKIILKGIKNPEKNHNLKIPATSKTSIKAFN